MCQQTRACNSKVNSAMWPNFELIEYFIPVLFICKFHKDWIKLKLCFRQSRIWDLFKHSWTSNSKVNILILPEFELVRDSRLFATFIKLQSKQNRLCSGQGQIWCFPHLRASNSKVNSPSWPEFQFVQNFMPVQVIGKFHKVLIKTKKAILWKCQIWVFWH